MWLTDIIHDKARKSPKNTAERKKFITMLETKAEVAEKVAVETNQNNIQATASLAAPERSRRQRSSSNESGLRVIASDPGVSCAVLLRVCGRL